MQPRPNRTSSGCLVAFDRMSIGVLNLPSPFRLHLQAAPRLLLSQISRARSMLRRNVSKPSLGGSWRWSTSIAKLRLFERKQIRSRRRSRRWMRF